MEYRIPGIDTDEFPQRINAVNHAPISITAFVGRSEQGPCNEACPVHDWLNFKRHFGGLSMTSTMSFAVRDFFENGGRHAIIVRLDNDTASSPRAIVASLEALDAVSVINLLCITPPDFEHDTDKYVWRQATLYCVKRHAILIIDPPLHWSSASQVSADINAGNMLSSTNAVTFYPRLKQYNPLCEDQVQQFVPCGAIAGVIARMDEQRGVWTSPAGVSTGLRGVEGLAVALTSPECGQLDGLGISCLRTLPRYGHVIWRARTLYFSAYATDWNYLSVRRTSLHVQQSLMLWQNEISFESNSETLWAEIHRCTTDFLHKLHQSGAFQGSTASEAYFVRCDRTTNSLADISLGRVNILLGLAPLRATEFIIISIRFETLSSATVPAVLPTRRV